MSLAASLSQLENAQLLRRVPESDPTYAFKHALTQETAYQSLLKSHRRKLHREVAQALEQVSDSRAQELSDVLAYHWERAEVPERARHYLFQAAQNAARRYASPEALALYTRALALSEGAPTEEITQLREERARIHEFLSQYAEAMADHEVALALARQSERDRDECRILGRMAWLHWLSGHGSKAVEMAQEAEARAQTLDDRSVALRAYLVRGLVAQADGHLLEAYPRMRQALFASRANRERSLEGESWFYLGIQNNFMGRFGRAAACAQMAYEIKRDLDDRVGEIVSLYLKARAEGGRGNYDASLEALEAGRAVAEEIHNPFGLAQYPNTRAWLCAELGDWQTAYELDKAGLDEARTAPVRPPEISTLINLVLDCTALDKFDQAEAYAAELQMWMGRPEFGFHAWRWKMRLADARARLFLAQDRLPDGLDAVDELLALALQTYSQKYLARGKLLRAQISLAERNISAAAADLAAARDLADPICYFPVRVHARQGLYKVYRHAQDYTAAARVREETSQLIDHLDRCLKHSQLRQSFLRGLAGSLSERPISN